MFVALVIHHAIRMHRIKLSFVAYPVLQNFSALPYKRHDFCVQILEHKMCVFCVQIVEHKMCVFCVQILS